MKQIWSKLFTSKVSMLGLVVFIIIIGSATVIENIYDTNTVNLLIYKAKWFEIILVFLVIQFFFNQKYKNLFNRQKLPQLIFHFSFVVIIIGGGISRYIGYEANMHILEGEAVNEIYTTDPYLQIRIPEEEADLSSDGPLFFSQLQNNHFKYDFKLNDNTNLVAVFADYLFDAVRIEDRNEADGLMQSFIIGDGRDSPKDVLRLNLIWHEKSYDVELLYIDSLYIQPFRKFDIGGTTMELTYGPKPVDLPFSIELIDFNLSKYPGTAIPSASESRVVLIDERNSDVAEKEYIIAKNQVLDYDGYRFFQTSYDDDEKGTILSVNYDYYGTRITYLGYIFMTLGSILILVSKNSLFSKLDSKIKEVRAKRKAIILTAFFVAGTCTAGYSQKPIQKPISHDHAENFGQLLVQTYDGRFSTVHSLAIDVIHKISAKDKVNISGKGEMDAMHLFMDIVVDPDFWKDQNIIIVREKALRKMLGISGKHASFNQFFYPNNDYKLEKTVKNAYKKKASEQTALDRELIRVTERVNIFSMVNTGAFLKIFPVQNSDNYQWINWTDSQAYKPLMGELMIFKQDFMFSDLNYNNIMRNYLISTLHAKESGDYSKPDRLVGQLKSIQRKLGPENLLPSEKKINAEVFYNKANIFEKLKYVYGILGLCLLVLTIIDNFKLWQSRFLPLLISLFIGMMLFSFAIQTFGMGLRWWLGGHAPWSNGYEVLLLVAWGGVLAGFSMVRYSKITLASTALLAFFILMTAGHSYYDPQLTNLNPVLKSYWLIIHVAIITIGYGFLTLGFLTAITNLVLYLFKTGVRKELFTYTIQELTLINEKLLTIGMLLTAVGLYIGCVWANESWGSYWAWNAKQTWSLIIVLVYGLILHFKFIPKMKSELVFNIGAIVAFGSVLMTFIGVNYYFTKGMHSYATDDPPIFPLWAWIAIIALFSLIAAAIAKENIGKKAGHT